MPIADRYLYCILPGLMGGTLFTVVALGRRLELGAGAARVVAALGIALVTLFAFQGAGRARLWSNPTLLYLDAAKNYPEGRTAAFFAARRAAQEGDAVAAVAALRRAAERGLDRFMVVRDDPGLAPIRGSAEFQAFLGELAGRWIEQASQREDPTVPDLRVMADAHVLRGEYAEAEAVLERALALGGPLEGRVRDDLASVRARRPDTAAGEAEEAAGHRPQIP